MIEVEVKLPIKNREETEIRLQSLGFRPFEYLREEDIYFDNDEGQIRRNGEALRIRRKTDLNVEETVVRVTFKGHKMDQVSMTRPELETEVADANVFQGILNALGYQPVPPQVVKIRREYKRNQMSACLDSVENLGDFLELELVIPQDGDDRVALAQIETMLQKLGYSLKDTVTNSYLSMLQHTVD